MAKGKLFVFEGTNEVGKSTLASMLSNSFKDKGIPCILTAFPGKEPKSLGELVHNLHYNLSNLVTTPPNPLSLQLLHVAAHVEAIQTTILPALNEGTNVILDRFWWSTWAYGKATSVNERALRSALEVEQIVWGRTHPAHVFLLTRKTPLAHVSDIPLWKKIARNYTTLLKREKRNHAASIIPNESTPVDTFAKIAPIAEKLASR